MPASKKTPRQVRTATLRPPPEQSPAPLAPPPASTVPRPQTVPLSDTARLRPHLRTVGMRKLRPSKNAPHVPPRELQIPEQAPSPDLLAEWLSSAPAGTLRFFSDEESPAVSEPTSQQQYFTQEYSCLAEGAASIAAALGFSPARSIAATTATSAIGYWRLGRGFAGVFIQPAVSIGELLDLE